MKNINNSPIFFFENAPKVSYPDGSEVKHQVLENQEQLSKEVIVLIKDSQGKECSFSSRTVEYEGKVFISPLPNPVHLLLNIGIDSYNQSIWFLYHLKKDCQLDDEKNKVHILNIGKDRTNANFNNFIKSKITSVISLVTSLEAFLNQIIPNNFIYFRERKGKIEQLDKKKIESSSVSFYEKLTEVISQVINNSNFINENKKLIQLIQNLYLVRRDIIHLKTNSDKEIDLYFKSTGSIIELDLEKSINATKQYINIVKTEFL